jgi:hypothetical protein
MVPINIAGIARQYAARGIVVFPVHTMRDGSCSCGIQGCHSPAKHPRTERGFKDATNDLNQIAAWWEQWPDANIGMPTAGFLVLDVDPRNGGDESLAALVAEHGPLPETAEQATGGGGRHIIFRHPGRRLPKTLAPGIDLKGEGGYIVVAPSIHASGKRYQWHGGRANGLLHPANPPGWLLERIEGARNGAGAQDTVDPDKWPPGERNNRLTSIAGTMRRRGVSKEAITAALLEENQHRCDPPLPEGEVRSIAESVASYKPADNREPTRTDDSGESDFCHSNWPDELKPEAYYGVSGELVRNIEPHSEADPAALLVQFLVAFGNVIGRRAHFVAEADLHFTNLFAVIVGQTSKARKGTSLGQVQQILATVDPVWSNTRMMGGLSSGEGLIWAVRDEIRERTPLREKGRVTSYEEIVSDTGEKDKRLLVIEPEFARVLQVAERETNTLSAIIRQAWDTGNLRILTKRQAAQATEAHIALIGHITKDELRRLLTDTAAGNGFANRFLWVCARRSKVLPEGGALHTVDFAPIIRRVQAAVVFAADAGEMRRDEQARAIWRDVYSDLSEGKPGMLGAVTSRAEAQTMRLATLYALLDCAATIRAEHLLAALAVWQYGEDSARFVFGDALGDATADEILRELRGHPGGITRNEIREHFSRNKSAAEIGRALGVLQEYGLGRMVRGREQEGQTRPTERWFAVTAVRG